MSNSSSDGYSVTQNHLFLAERQRHAFDYEKAFESLDTALQIQGTQPAERNVIWLRKLAYQIEYYWLTNRLGLELMTLQSEREATYESAVLRGDSTQIAENLFLKARLHHFCLFEATSPDLDAAEQDWITAHDHYQQLNDARGMAESLFYHGLLYQRFKSDQEEAFKYFQRADTLLKGESYPIEQSEIYRHTGYVYQHRGDLVAARECYENAVALLDQAGFRVYLPLALYVLGMILMAQGHIDDAALHLERGLAVAQEAPANILHVGALLGLGDLYLAKGDAAQARDHVQRAHDIALTLKSARFVKIASDKLALLPSLRSGDGPGVG